MEAVISGVEYVRMVLDETMIGIESRQPFDRLESISAYLADAKQIRARLVWDLEEAAEGSMRLDDLRPVWDMITRAYDSVLDVPSDRPVPALQYPPVSDGIWNGWRAKAKRFAGAGSNDNVDSERQAFFIFQCLRS